MKKYKLNMEFTAIQLTDDNWDDVVAFCDTKHSSIKKYKTKYYATLCSFGREYQADKGYWLVKTAAGHIEHPVPNKYFLTFYDEV